MNPRRPILLSPYRMPTHHQVYLGEDEIAAWLNGYLLLWHPALLHGSGSLPAIASANEHESPLVGDLFAVPENPPQYLADNWKDRVATVGGLAFVPGETMAATRSNFYRAWEEINERGENPAHAIFRDDVTRKLWELPESAILPFAGLGIGYIVVESLFDAMDHEHLLDSKAFRGHLLNAVKALADGEPSVNVVRELTSAAQLLMSAREALYPSKISLLDFWELSGSLIEELGEALSAGHRATLLASGDRLAMAGTLRDSASNGNLSVLMAGALVREDAVLPLESQLWNLRTGIRQCETHLGILPAGYASSISNFTPQIPSLLKDHNLNYIWWTARDAAILPSHYAPVVNWPGPDGKSVEALAKPPHPAHDAGTYFNLAYLLHQSIGADSNPTLVFLHDKAKPNWVHSAWLALSKLAPVLGEWLTAADYLRDTSAGEYAGVTNADDIALDLLDQRVTRNDPHPLSQFAIAHRERRRVDADLTFTSILQVLNSNLDSFGVSQHEDSFERNPSPYSTEGVTPASRLAQRLVNRTSGGEPGWLILNPFGFTRRASVTLIDVKGHIPIEGAVKAADFADGKLNAVVEVPPLGYAWIPNTAKGKPEKPKLKMTDERIVRNEFLEVEIDPVTGGLRGLRDTKTKVNRVGQQLVFNPGSTMVPDANGISHTKTGATVAAIESRGTLRDSHGQVLARYTQTFEVWSGRPMAEMTIHLEPVDLPQGQPWHSYYGSRFAWRDERAALFRGVNGMACQTTHARPQTPDYLEIRSGRNNTCIFPGGLPFHQKTNNRMVDTLLIVPGETATEFRMCLALDRENPQQTAMGLLSPVAVVPSEHGPPAGGPSSWLFHIDSPNLLMTSMRPRETTDDSGVAVVMQFLEVAGQGGLAELRCVRNPKRAVRVNGLDEESHELGCSGDAISLEYSAHEYPRICVWFA